VHELAIADAVVRIASEHAAGRPVARVNVRVGHLRQVVPSALELAFQLVADGSDLQHAELVVEHVPAVVRCRACAADTTVDGFPLRCAACGDLDVDVVAGEELIVESLDIEDAPELEGALTMNGGMTYGG
jgi:hydrogenase nickel incorporation protein HypA/HybF